MKIRVVHILIACISLGCEQEKEGFGFATTQPEQQDQCVNPVQDTWSELYENAQARGLDLEFELKEGYMECAIIPGGVVAQDLNGDGWDDLVFLNHEGAPWIYQNYQGGLLREVELNLPLFGMDRPVLSVGAMDLNGDNLPDLIQTGMGFLAISTNLGGFEFAPWELVLNQAGFPYSCYGTFAIGDIDKDGDLDIVLAGTDEAIEEGVWPGIEYPYINGAKTLLLENTSVGWQEAQVLESWEDVTGASILQAFTDFDNDFDVDVLSSSDRSNGVYYPPMALWENKGVVEGQIQLEDAAPDLSIDLPISGMGLGSNDLNGDGFLDYCISDISESLTCLLSDGSGGFYEAGVSMNLVVDPTKLSDVPEAWTNPDENIFVKWSAWSVVLQDIDNNGHLDLAATGGQPPDFGNVLYSEVVEWQPDWLWIGSEDGFEEASLDHPWFDPQNMYGMVSVDLDHDGYRELVKAPAQGRPQIWTNDCGNYNWLEIDLLGKGNNLEAYGAKVFVEYGDKVDIQEVHGLLTMGQSPSSIHVGLGNESRASKIEVWWPDGAVTTYTDIPANERLTLKQPE